MSLAFAVLQPHPTSGCRLASSADRYFINCGYRHALFTKKAALFRKKNANASLKEPNKIRHQLETTTVLCPTAQRRPPLSRGSRQQPQIKPSSPVPGTIEQSLSWRRPFNQETRPRHHQVVTSHALKTSAGKPQKLSPQRSDAAVAWEALLLPPSDRIPTRPPSRRPTAKFCCRC